MNNDDFKPIFMTEDFWMHTQFSIARHYGGVRVGGCQYLIVGSDLCRLDFLPMLHKLGRERFVEVLKANQTASDKVVMAAMREALEQTKDAKAKEKDKELKLFNDEQHGNKE